MKTSSILLFAITSTLAATHPTGSSQSSDKVDRSISGWWDNFENWAGDNVNKAVHYGESALSNLVPSSVPTSSPVPTSSVPAPTPSSSYTPPSPMAATRTGVKGWWKWKPSCCDLSTVTKLPANAAAVGAATPLPVPSAAPVHIMVGRGTQNYTCDLSNSTAVPSPVGAVADLYDASCYAASSMGWLSAMTRSALRFLPNFPEENLGDFAPLKLVGHHFFTDSTSPRFDLNTANSQWGIAVVKKAAAVDAPPVAMPDSVQWLFLDSAGTTGSDYSSVYRVDTQGGNAPKSCQGQKASFELPYAASYWFYK